MILAKDKLVSIIIPSYNYAHYLEDTLQCLVNQSFTHWEAIIIDDGSTDETSLIVHKFANMDNRFIYYYQENQGMSAARNNGIDVAIGKYIALLDADDLFSERKIERQLRFMEAHPEIDLSYSEAYYFLKNIGAAFYKGIWIKSGGKIEFSQNEWIPKIKGSGSVVIDRLLKSNIAPVNSFMFKKEVWQNTGGFREDLSSLEDWDFWLRSAIKGFKFAFFPDQDALALIRVHTSGMSANFNKMYYFYPKVIRPALKELKVNPVAGLDLRAIEFYYYSWIRDVIRNLGLFNIKKLGPILGDVGVLLFVKLYLKELNLYRKSFFKPKSDSR